MIVLILEKAPPSLRGELTRWLHEPRANVYVGRTSALVRHKLWEKVKRDLGPQSGALLVHTSDTEPGFEIHTHGDTTRRVALFDGLQLIQRDHPNRDAAMKKLAARPPRGDRLSLNWDAPPGRPDEEVGDSIDPDGGRDDRK